jgi:hypothetical protein
LTRGSDDAAFSNWRARGLPPPTATGAQEGLQRGSGGHSVVVVVGTTTTWSTGRPCAAAHAVGGGGGGGPIQHTQGMKRNREDVREEGGALNQQQDWVVALQSPRVADKVSDDIVRVLSKRRRDAAPGPDTLAFLEDMVQTLRLER